MAKEAAPGLDRLSSINADGSRKFIHPSDVHGRFVTARNVVYFILIAIYVVMPFVHIGGHPAMQLDVESRRFYLFGAVFNAQDFWRAVFLLLTVGAGLFFVTTWYGRVWCGWACPQTVFLEGVYRRIERLIEGPREKRMRLEAAPWTFDKILKKVSKHTAYVLISLALAHVATAFFVSVPALWDMMHHAPKANWVAFVWVMSVTALLYFNFAWFREQLCIVICPYGRLQSVMLDRDSIIIGYDVKRGEPRGKSTRAERTGTSLPVVQKGDCVDCNRCVTVCPTGIDIRNGTQLECIGCAQCIDACDDVMSKLNRPKGLIRYDSQNGLDGEKRRVLRPRLMIYGALVLATSSALLLATLLRTKFEANLLRVSGAPYVLEADSIRNQFELHLVNKNAGETTFHIEVTGPVPLNLTIPMREVKVASLEHYRLPIFASVKQSDFKLPFELKVTVKDDASAQERVVTARFLGPMQGAQGRR
jgi:cytochrome c oxidase accessory protein FixG